MVRVNDVPIEQLTIANVGMPLVITASYNESIRIHEVSDIYGLLSAMSKVAAILNQPKEG